MSVFSCNKTQEHKESPFIIVVKLLSAEQKLDYNEAQKYIDVDKVYSKYLGSKDPEKEWKELLQFNYNLGKDPKFSNSIDFYKYDITENITKEDATVVLTEKDIEAPIKKIIYKLDFLQNQWIVTSIDYIKNE